MTTSSSTSLTTASKQVGEVKAPRVLLYSDDSTVREQVRLAVGQRVAQGDPDIVWKETATHAAVEAAVKANRFDLLILDGEADKAGGMGVCRQLKNEVFNCPPVLVLTARPQDGWLASWSLADDAVARPFDVLALRQAVVGLLQR